MKKTVSLAENHRFRALYAKGKSAASHTLVVYSLRNRLKTQNRLGITVSTKIGGAVTRNRARRRLREIYRANEHLLRSGIDIVLVARHATATAPFSELEQDFLALTQRTGLWEQTNA